MNDPDWAVAFAAAWIEDGPGGKAPLPLTPAVLAATTVQQQRLARGRDLVPGTTSLSPVNHLNETSVL